MGHTIAHDASYDTALAIISMSGRFPGARNAEAFWQNIAGGVKSIRFFSDEELKAAGVDPALLRQPNYVRAGTVVEDIEDFDASFFGYTPREAEIMDPQHRLFMECAWEALESAAYDPETYTGLVGVFAGSAFSSYMSDHIYTNPDVVNMAGRLQIDLGNERDSLASAVSYKLNLRGPSLAVQTFCSTSLVAVHLACQSLSTYECDIALAGGVAIALPQINGYLYEEGGILSPDGECRAFDARGRGSVMGNGVGVVALKRLQEAIEDRDHIYAVIRGSAVNNDGSMHVSYTAPGLNGQKEVIAEAIGHAGVDLESISYVEAHGTATMLGDAVELAAMIKAFEAKTSKKQFCAIGSVKPNIGHLDRASGVTGLIKTTLALHHRQLPPSLNFEQSSPDINLDDSPFYVNTALRSWPRSDDTPRRAGVSSFGLGGTNAHVVLEEAPEREPASPSRPWQLLMLSARTEAALQNMTANLAEYLKAHREQTLPDVASTLQIGRKVFNHRRIVVCRDSNDAIQALDSVDPRRVHTLHQTYKERKLAFLFPGVGEQYPGLAKDLYQEEVTFRETFDHCASFLKTRFGLDIREALGLGSQPVQASRNGRLGSGGGTGLQALLNRGGRNQTASGEQLKQTVLAQPAVFVIEYALAQLLMEWGIRPEAMIGYSLGEYVVACLAGVFSLEDALTLVARRARLIQELPHGAMVAVALSEDAVQPFLDEQICLAAINGPNTCVLSGPVEAIELLERRLSEQWIAAQRVDTTHAFHSTMLESLSEPLTELVSELTLHSPRIPYLSNITGTWITDEQATDPAYWAQHMCKPVRFADGAGILLQNAEWLLLEVGPGQSLSSFIRQHPACSHDRLHLVLSTLPSLYERQSDLAFLLTTLGKLWLAGVSIDWTGFYAREQRYRVPLPTYPFERQRYWIEASKIPWNRQQSAPVIKGKKPDLTDWFYLPSWEQVPLLPDHTTTWLEQSPYLVFADSCGLGEQLALRLRCQGAEVVVVRPGERYEQRDDRHFVIRQDEKADYLTLCKALSSLKLMPRTVLHCWSVTQDEEEVSAVCAFRSHQQKGLYSLLYLTQAFGSQVYEEPVQIVLISNHMQAVTGQELIQPGKATALGACKIVPQEHLNITCRSIDLSLAGAAIYSDTHLLRALVAELTSSDLVVAYRGRTRWVQVYRNICLSEERRASTKLRERGVYLITGGLGNVGLVVAKYLAREVQARLVIVGRSVLPERSHWSEWLAEHEENHPGSVVIRALQAIEELGSEVLVISADVADSQQLASVFAQIEERFGALHGVIHAAGSSDPAGYQTVQDIDSAACELHFRPKAYGLFALEQELQGLDLDFCVLFSSVSAMLGGLGFTGYAAANIFMDAFVQKHNAEAEVPWISVNWDTWLVKENVHGVLGSTIAEYVMTPEEGTEVFARAIASGIDQLVISTGDLETRLNQWIRREPAHMLDQAADATSGTGNSDRPNLSTPYVAASTEHEQKVIDIWQQVLGINQIGIHDNFFELGGHSLIGTQLISRLRHTFQVNLPLAMLFDAPTVAELTLAIKMKLIEEIDRLGEEEVQRLV